MFTGIIEEVGKIRAIERQAVSARLTVAASKVLSDVHLGDSIAVNRCVSDGHVIWERLFLCGCDA